MPLRLLRQLRRTRASAVVMEGTGVAGGVGLILARLLLGMPYVVSTGDAVGPFIATRWPLLGPVAAIYERALYRWSAGVVAWSPYLTGRALTLGAPRAMTAAHFASFEAPSDRGGEMRARLGVPADAVVFGIVGSLHFNARVGYCYGAELVRAICSTDRLDLRVVVVGGGDGLSELERLAGDELGRRVLLAGACPSDEVADHLAAFDIASLPQSLDLVGMLRYTTKLPEYLAAGLPIVTGQLPLSYDLSGPWLERLPGEAPWDPVYIAALARFMTEVSRSDLARRGAAVPAHSDTFDADRQSEAVCAFVADVVRRFPR